MAFALPIIQKSCWCLLPRLPKGIICGGPTPIRQQISEACPMSLTLYAHPFAAYCWKVLIALYENGTPFTYRVIEDAAGWADLETLWPIKKFPLLRDGEALVVESS